MSAIWLGTSQPPLAQPHCTPARVRTGLTMVRDTSDHLMADFPSLLITWAEWKPLQTGAKVPACTPVFRGAACFLTALTCEEHGAQIASTSWTERGASASSWDATLDSSESYCVNNVRFSTKLVPPQSTTFPPRSVWETASSSGESPTNSLLWVVPCNSPDP